MHCRISNIGAKMMVAWPLGSECVAGHYIALKRSGYVVEEIWERKGVFGLLCLCLIINRGIQCITASTDSPLHIWIQSLLFSPDSKNTKGTICTLWLNWGPGEIIRFSRLHFVFTLIVLYGSQYLVRVQYFCLHICSRDETKERYNITQPSWYSLVFGNI